MLLSHISGGVRIEEDVLRYLMVNCLLTHILWGLYTIRKCKSCSAVEQDSVMEGLTAYCEVQYLSRTHQ